MIYGRLKIVLSMLSGIKEKDKLLDIGPSPNFTILLNTPRCRKYAVDMAPTKIKGVILKKGDLNAERIPFPSNSFDYVVCTEVIEHLWNPDNLLSEINRVLKTSGVLVLSTPNSASLFNRIRMLFGRSPGCSMISLREHPGGHIRCYTLLDLVYLLEKYGFKIKEIRGSESNSVLDLRNLIACVPELSTYLILKVEKRKG